MCTCVSGKIVFKFIFRGITMTILNETIVAFIGFELISVKKTTTIFLN